MDVLKVLEELVNIRSPSGREDEIVKYVHRAFSEMGYEPEILEGYGVKNVILRGKSDLWVVTHLDTVPFKRGFSYDGRYAYGTGVCDTKASIAAIMLALSELDRLKLNVALLSDEEEGGRGSRAFVKSVPPSKAVVMEPTSLKIANVHYGSLEVLVKARGVSSHGSMPEMGVNAIEVMIDAIRRLKNSLNPSVKMLVQEIRGGGDEYVVPDLCVARIDFVFPPEVKMRDLMDMVGEIISECELEIIEGDDGFVSGDVCKILESAVRAAGYEPLFCEMPSWTDAINLFKSGWDVVVFGPGDLSLCHTENERISVNEIIKAKNVLTRLNDIIK